MSRGGRRRNTMPAPSKRRPGRPHKVLLLTTYDRLEQYL
jgi:hypothetical protein